MGGTKTETHVLLQSHEMERVENDAYIAPSHRPPISDGRLG